MLLYKAFGGQMFSFLLAEYPRVEILSQRVDTDTCLTI